MATWKKIVTESTADNISQNAATATALASAQNFSITGEVEASAISFNGTGAVALAATVKDGVIDTANFTPSTLVVAAEGIAGNDNDATIATNAAIIDYVAAQVSASGSGTITGVQVDDGNGIASTVATSVTSGQFSTVISAVGYNGISVDTNGINAAVDGATIGLAGSAGSQTITAITTGGVADGGANLVTGDQVFDYITNNTTTNTGTVTEVDATGSVSGLTLTTTPVGGITGTGTVQLGGALSNVPNTALANNSITLGSTAMALGTTHANIDGMSSMDGVGGGMTMNNVKSIQWDGGDVSLFTNLDNHNVTIGSNNSGYGVVIAGDLTVQGTTTTINTETLEVEDKDILLASNAGSIASATLSGIVVNTTTTDARRPKVRWQSGKGGGTNGQGTFEDLTGWTCSNARTSGNSLHHPIAIMDFDSTVPGSTTYAGGKGSFYYRTVSGADNDEIYIRID